MPNDGPDSPRKTLTLGKRSAPESAQADKRQRSGARARLVAQYERAREQREQRQERPAPPTAPDESDPAARRPASARPPKRPDTSATANRADARRKQAKTPTRTDTQTRGQTERPGSFAPVHTIAAPVAELFSIFAPCPQGLEEVLTAEMQALGFADARAGRAGCHYTADWSGVQKSNLYSRLATRILVQVAHAPIQTEDDILELARATSWERWFGAEQTLRVDTSAIKSPMQSLQFCNLRAKDGICDRLREVEGARPNIDTARPDARVHLFLTKDTATLYLDTSGESLFKRGWRLDKGEAPLRENLAAGMLALAGWDPAGALFDPFCGSGTILIEAAWIALGIPPGIARPLGFERLRGHDAHAWRATLDEAESRIRPGLDAPLVGCDLDPQAIEHARSNTARAWLADDAIRFEVGNAAQARPPAPHGWIVTNPPYGDRMAAEDESLWLEWAANLKHHFGGWQMHVITSDRGLPGKLHLKPGRRTPLFNGALDCRLFGFDLVAAAAQD